MSGERMGAFPALKPGTGGKAPSVVKAVSGPHGEQPDMMRQGYITPPPSISVFLACISALGMPPHSFPLSRHNDAPPTTRKAPVC